MTISGYFCRSRLFYVYFMFNLCITLGNGRMGGLLAGHFGLSDAKTWQIIPLILGDIIIT
jgi:hypothetical protein